MQSEDTRVLTSWKEIAGHLDVTVRTAQLWEKQRGLPVRRMPGPRGRVYLRIDEYEAWLASADEADGPAREAPGTGAPPGTGTPPGGSAPPDTGAPSAMPPGPTSMRAATPRTWLLIAAVAIVSVLLGMLAAPRFSTSMAEGSSAADSRVPTSAYVSGRELIVENAAGEELWRKRFEFELDEVRESKGTRGPTVADIDGDGTVEVLFPRITADRVVADVLLCYSAAGDEMWRFRPGRPLENDKQEFNDVYRVGHYEPVDLGNGRRVIFVAAIHHLYEPTQITLLEVDGRPTAEYWHSGHLGHWQENLAFADLDGNGIKEIYAGGVNNARRSATLVVLDPDTMAGASRDPHGFQLEGFETDREVARVFFPRSSMNLSENQYNVANGVFPGPGGIVVGTLELYGITERPGIIYELELDLTLRQIGLSDGFKAMHEKLIRQQVIAPTTLERELELLWQQGIRVLRAGET